MLTFRFSILSLLFVLCASGASAATLTVAGGQLVGATGVSVGGGSYDVVFSDGTCIGLYAGCDAVTDFTFQSEADATAASQALLDQVFLDGTFNFDSAPELTTGCTDSSRCNVWTPYGLSGSDVLYARVINNGGATADSVVTSSADTGVSTVSLVRIVYGVWTVSSVPEPTTTFLLVAGATVWLAGRRTSIAR